MSTRTLETLLPSAEWVPYLVGWGRHRTYGRGYDGGIIPVAIVGDQIVIPAPRVEPIAEPASDEQCEQSRCGVDWRDWLILIAVGVLILLASVVVAISWEMRG